MCEQLFEYTLMSCMCLKVAKVNPKDGSFVLRDHFYKLVQKDWPSYSEEDRQLIGRLLARWVIIQPFLTSSSTQHPPDSTLI